LVDAYNKLTADVRVKDDTPARVIFARDTRASGSRLVACLVDALDAAGVEYTDYKLLTTPQLHYLVRCSNTQGTTNAYGELSEKGYYEKLAGAFKAAMKHSKGKGAVTVDCANGVGGPKLRELVKYLPGKDEGVEIKIVNDDVHKPENLNMQVSPFFPLVCSFSQAVLLPLRLLLAQRTVPTLSALSALRAFPALPAC
jgi:phosphoacetylglucosamine mutase